MKFCEKLTYHLGVGVDQLRHKCRIDGQFGHLGRRRRVKRPSVRIRLSFTIEKFIFFLNNFIRVDLKNPIIYLPAEWRRFGIGRRPSPVWPPRREISDWAGRSADLQFDNRSIKERRLNLIGCYHLHMTRSWTVLLSPVPSVLMAVQE
jgi:hypothetical protein